jgi:hypothetical protein
LLYVKILTFRIFRCFLDFGEICARLMWGVVVYLHSFLTSTLEGAVSCSLLTAAALFPSDAASDAPLVGGREGHRSSLDALGELKKFYP